MNYSGNFVDQDGNKYFPKQQDTGWINATLANGIDANANALGGFSGVRYRKVENHVFINGSVEFNAPASGTVLIATLPAGFRPTKGAWYILSPTGGTRMARVFVKTDGTINLEWIVNISNGSRYSGGAWLQVNIDFFVD